MSPELTALLTRIDALVADGVCTPAEAMEHRRRALDTEVRIPLSRSLTHAVSLAGSAPRVHVRLWCSWCLCARAAGVLVLLVVLVVLVVLLMLLVLLVCSRCSLGMLVVLMVLV